MVDLKNRTFKFSINVITLIEKIENSKATSVISYQIIKSCTSVGANYRAAKRARSDREFIAKLNIVLEEVDETLFWLEIIKEKKYIQHNTLDILLAEANELTAIFVSTLKTMNSKMKK